MTWTSGSDFTIPSGWTSGSDFTIASGKTATGALVSGPSGISGSAYRTLTASGTLTSQASAISGTATQSGVKVAVGQLSADDSTISGSARASKSAVANLLSQPSEVSGFAALSVIASAALSAQLSQISGTSSRSILASGALDAGSSVVTGTANKYWGIGANPSTINVTIEGLSGANKTTLTCKLVASGANASTLNVDLVDTWSGANASTLNVNLVGSGANATTLDVYLYTEGYIVPVVVDPPTVPTNLPAPALLSGTPTIRWGIAATVNGVDVSSRLTGTLEINAEESSARVATIRVRPASGVIDLYSYTRKPVTLTYIHYNPVTLAEEYRVRLFNGKVDAPRFVAASGAIELTCTDEHQKSIESMTLDQIYALVGGHFSKYVFEEKAQPLQRFTDLMSTQPYAVDKSIDGGFVKTPWAAKTTPDFTFRVGQVIYGSVDPSLGSARDIVNRINLDFQYGYTAYRERAGSFIIDAPQDFGGDYNQGLSYWPPSMEAFMSSLDSAGLVCLAVPSAVGMPPPGSYHIHSSTGLGATTVYWQGATGDFITEATAYAGFRYTQSVVEKYSITVECTDSIESIGLAETNESASLSATYNADLDDYTTTTSYSGEYTYMGLLGIKQTIPFNYTGYLAAVALPVTVSGVEKVYDADASTKEASRADRNQARLTRIEVAKTDILAGHRRTQVSWDSPINPLIDRVHTARLDIPAVTAKGKVFSVTHRFNYDDGTAITSVTVSISQARAVGVPATPETIYPPDLSDPPDTSVTGIKSSTVLPKLFIPSTPFNGQPTEVTYDSPGVYVSIDNPAVIVVESQAGLDTNIDEQIVEYGGDAQKVVISVPNDEFTTTAEAALDGNDI